MIEFLESRRLLAFPAQALSFGDLGVISHSVDDIRNGLVKLPNDRFLSYGNVRLAVYRNDGALDTSFGTTGTRRLPFPIRDGDAYADGRTILTGAKQNDYTVSVARLNPDGAYDTTFAGDGRISFQIAGRPLIYQTSIMSTLDGGAILVVSHWTIDGQPGSEATVMFKLTSTGAFDPAVGGANGVKLLTGFHNDIERVRGASGAFYVGGSSTAFGGGYVARINSDGTFDGTFNTRRYEGPEPRALAADDQGRVVVAAGIFGNTTVLARLSSSGSFDSSFSGNGKIDLSLPSQELPKDVQVVDGKISLLYAFQGGGFMRDRIYRFNDDGTPDTSFGDDGIFSGPRDYTGAGAMLITDDGAIITTAFSRLRRFDDSPDMVVENQTAFVRGTDAADTLTVAAGAAGGVKITLNGVASDFTAGAVTQVRVSRLRGRRLRDRNDRPPVQVRRRLRQRHDHHRRRQRHRPARTGQRFPHHRRRRRPHHRRRRRQRHARHRRRQRHDHFRLRQHRRGRGRRSHFRIAIHRSRQRRRRQRRDPRSR